MIRRRSRITFPVWNGVVLETRVHPSSPQRVVPSLRRAIHSSGASEFLYNAVLSSAVSSNAVLYSAALCVLSRTWVWRRLKGTATWANLSATSQWLGWRDSLALSGRCQTATRGLRWRRFSAGLTLSIIVEFHSGIRGVLSGLHERVEYRRLSVHGGSVQQ